MVEPINRQTRYQPLVAAPVEAVETPKVTKAIHLRLDPVVVKCLALAKIESGATVETIVEALLIQFQKATSEERALIYTLACEMAEQRKKQGLAKRKRG